MTSQSVFSAKTCMGLASGLFSPAALVVTAIPYTLYTKFTGMIGEAAIKVCVRALPRTSPFWLTRPALTASLAVTQVPQFSSAHHNCCWPGAMQVMITGRPTVKEGQIQVQTRLASAQKFNKYEVCMCANSLCLGMCLRLMSRQDMAQHGASRCR